jgi:phage gp36-like protein
MFGYTQIIKWSDIDGERQDTPTMEDRIQEALIDADDYINERLADNGYVVPFTSVPRRIVSLATLYAGIYLYDNKLKGGAMNEARDEVARPRRRFNMVLKQILDGRLLLLHPLSGEVITKTSATTPIIPGTTLSCNDDCCIECGHFLISCICASHVWS